jgi:hypothetical protein
MLLVGTSHGLRDLESGEKFVDGMAVTALAPGGTEGWYALLDCRSVVRLDRDMAGTVPAGELPEPDGQSLVVLPDGTVVVGRTGARLSIVGPHGEVRNERHYRLQYRRSTMRMKFTLGTTLKAREMTL